MDAYKSSLLAEVGLHLCAKFTDGIYDVADADLRRLLELHIDVWSECLKESFVNRKHFVEVLEVQVHFVTEIRHGHRDVGCVIRRHLGKRREGEDADVFGADGDACCKGCHGWQLF